jgi:hypothetical protein
MVSRQIGRSFALAGGEFDVAHDAQQARRETLDGTEPVLCSDRRNRSCSAITGPIRNSRDSTLARSRSRVPG